MTSYFHNSDTHTKYCQLRYKNECINCHKHKQTIDFVCEMIQSLICRGYKSSDFMLLFCTINKGTLGY